MVCEIMLGKVMLGKVMLSTVMLSKVMLHLVPDQISTRESAAKRAWQTFARLTSCCLQPNKIPSLLAFPLPQLEAWVHSN